jgi:hypothetical protein
MNDEEAGHFGYFRSVCVADLSGFFEDPLWARLVLQASHDEPSIKHATVAFGALHRHKRYSPVEYGENRKDLLHYATTKYLQAVKVLNLRLDESPMSSELAILASLLFMAYEVFRGNDPGVLVHFEGAYAILQTLRQQYSIPETFDPSDLSAKDISISKSTPVPDSKPHPGNLDDLTTVFTRLEIQASTFARPYRPKPHAPPPLTTKITSLIQARDSLDDIIASLYFFLGDGSELRETLFDPEISLYSASSVEYLRLALDSWSSAFTNFVASRPANSPQAPVVVLQIQQLSAKVHVDTFAAPKQLVYDGSHASFTKIVELAESIVPTTPSANITSRSPFSFDTGIVYPTYCVAIQCRDELLRRRAQRVLACSGREGVWDGPAMAAVAAWVIEKEEEGLADEIGSRFVPEERRFHDVSFLFDRVSKHANVWGMRKGDGPGLDWEYVNGEIDWQ